MWNVSPNGRSRSLLIGRSRVKSRLDQKGWSSACGLDVKKKKKKLVGHMAVQLPSLLPLSVLFALCSLNVSMAKDALLPFLQRVQSEALRTMGPTNFDPKLYVDLPLKTDLPAAVSAFDSLPRQSGTIPVPDFNKFLKEFFDEAGSDLVYAKPVDFKPEPEGFLVKVENEEMRRWALEVHAIWKSLSRRVSDAVKIRPERHTLLYLPGTIIVPGSRFREVYYWDSYWVIR